MITHAASRKQYYTVLLDRPERMPLFDISLIFTNPDFPGEQLCDPLGTGFGPHTE